MQAVLGSYIIKFIFYLLLLLQVLYCSILNNMDYVFLPCIIAEKAVSHVINSRALTGKKPRINKAIHALLMHGYATFNMIVPGPQICCRYEMCTA